MDESDHFLSALDISVHLKVCKMTVYRLIKAGELSASRVGKQYRIEPAAFAAYLEKVRIGHGARDGQGSSAP